MSAHRVVLPARHGTRRRGPRDRRRVVRGGDRYRLRNRRGRCPVGVHGVGRKRNCRWAAVGREQNLEWDRWKREREEQEQAERERAEREAARKARIDGLYTDADNWGQARQLREYIAAAAETNPFKKSKKELAEWEKWARAEADRLDPLTL